MKRTVFGITLTLFLIGMLILRINVQPVESSNSEVLFLDDFTVCNSEHLWWNDNWQRRRKIDITENSGYNLTDFPVEVIFGHYGNAQPDGDDVRIIDDGTEIPSCLIDINGTHAKVMFETNISAFSTKSLYVYYGNQSVVAPNYSLCILTISGGNTGYAIIDNSVYIGWDYTSWGWSNNVELWNDFRIDFDGDNDPADDNDLIRDYGSRQGGIGRHRADIQAIGLGDYHGYAQTPVYVDIRFADVTLRIYKNHRWVETTQADSLYMFSPSYTQANYGTGTEEDIVDGIGVEPDGGNRVYVNKSNPFWMAFRDNSSGNLFASTGLRIGDDYAYHLGAKEFPDWDRVVNFNNRTRYEPVLPYDQPSDCRIYWYGDNSNNYTKIEEISTILNNQPTITVVPCTIIVPDDYPTIQEVINNANEGDTIFVRNGTYFEHVVVNKTVTLTGENKETTIIDGGLVDPGEIVFVAADNVEIRNFTIQNSRNGGSAIWVDGYVNTTISENIITTNSGDGIRILHSFGNMISDNIVKNNPYTSIGFNWAHDNVVCNNIIANNYIGVGGGYTTHNNTFSENTIINNSYGLLIAINDSKFYHNNIINNTVQAAFDDPIYVNNWDNGCEGNYWSDYNDTDSNGDGIGDNPYIIDENNADYYPLMNPYVEGDVNHDGIVNMRDIALCCNASFTYPGHPYWNCHCDINEDGTVNMRDISITCDNFMKTFEY